MLCKSKVSILTKLHIGQNNTQKLTFSDFEFMTCIYIRQAMLSGSLLRRGIHTTRHICCHKTVLQMCHTERCSTYGMDWYSWVANTRMWNIPCLQAWFSPPMHSIWCGFRSSDLAMMTTWLRQKHNGCKTEWSALEKTASLTYWSIDGTNVSIGAELTEPPSNQIRYTHTRLSAMIV